MLWVHILDFRGVAQITRKLSYQLLIDYVNVLYCKHYVMLHRVGVCFDCEGAFNLKNMKQ